MSQCYIHCVLEYSHYNYTPCFSETRVEDEEDLYDCVYGEDEGGEVYEDLMKAEEAQQPVGLLLIFKSNSK